MCTGLCVGAAGQQPTAQFTQEWLGGVACAEAERAACSAGARSPEVLLELMLIDTMISLPNDSLLAARSLASSQVAPDHARAALPGSSECALFILVSSVQGLPMLPAAAASGTAVAAQSGTPNAPPQLRAPSTFVAVKAARDVANGSAVQGATRVVGEQCNPVWYAPTDHCQPVEMQCCRLSSHEGAQHVMHSWFLISITLFSCFIRYP